MLLSDLPDSDLIKNIKQKNEHENDSIDILANRHGGLVADVYRKFNHTFIQSGICPQDVINDKKYVVYKTALSYEENKGSKYTTWLSNHVRYQCLDALNDKRKYISCSSINGDPDKFMDLFPTAPQTENQDSIIKNLIENIKDVRLRVIFELRYLTPQNDGKKTTWREIGKALETSGQNAFALHKKHLQCLTKTYHKQTNNKNYERTN